MMSGPGSAPRSAPRSTRHLVIALATILLGASALSSISLYRFNRELETAVFDKNEAVALSVTSFFERVLEQGVPFEGFVGVDELLLDVIGEHGELAYVAVSDANGHILHRAGDALRGAPRDALAHSIAMPRGQASRWAGHFDVAYPVVHERATIGYLHLGVTALPVRALLDELFYDVLTVLLIAMLIAYELLMYSVHSISAHLMRRIRRLYDPAAQHARVERFATTTPSGIENVRPALFLMVFAEALSVSFLPLFTEELYRPIPGLSREMVIGLPISVFMLVFALCLPWVGRWSDRRGRRVSYVTGALLAALGMALTAFSDDMYEFLLYRAITAVGYATGYITCQGYIADASRGRGQGKSSSIFLATFFAGSLSGSGIGGILAERISYRATFTVSACVALAAAIFVYVTFRGTDAARDRTEPRARGGLRELVRTRGVMSVVLLSAIPAKLVLTGILYYAGPIYLGGLGVSQSSIGRILLAYGVVIIIASPIMGRLADRFSARDGFIIGGGLLTSVSLFILYSHGSVLGFFAAIALLGVAHSAAISAQGALIMHISEERGLGAGATMGWFRFVERSGSVAGPLLIGACVTSLGFDSTFAILAVVTLGEVLLLGWILLRRRLAR